MVNDGIETDSVAYVRLICFITRLLIKSVVFIQVDDGSIDSLVIPHLSVGGVVSISMFKACADWLDDWLENDVTVPTM